jgi:hypothetical protein
MSSEKRNAANARNSQHSSGPKTDEGKNNSRFNAVKHGLTAKLLEVLPDEDQGEYDNRIDLFLSGRPNASPEQVVLMKRIVSADWKLDRLDQAQVATITHKMRHAAQNLDTALMKNAEEIGQRLIYECIDRGESAEWRNPIVQERIQRRANDHPKCLRIELERTAQGVDWLLERWDAMRGHLRFYSYWHTHQKFEAIRLLGKRPADVCEDAEIGTIFVACNMIHIQPFELLDECLQAKFDVIGRPMFYKQLDQIVAEVHKRCFKDSEGAWDWLDAFVTKQIDRLTALKAELQPIADADMLGAIHAAKFDASPSGIALTRYQADLTRQLHRSVNDLMKQRKCDATLEDGFDGALGVVVDTKTPVVEAVVEVKEVVSRNEPIAEVPVRKEVAPKAPLLDVKADPNSSFINVSASRNEPEADAKGPKRDPGPSR